MRGRAVGDVDDASVALLELFQNGFEHGEFVVDLALSADDHREAGPVLHARAERIGEIKAQDMLGEIAGLDLVEHV